MSSEVKYGFAVGIGVLLAVALWQIISRLIRRGAGG